MAIDNIYIFSRAVRTGKTTELSGMVKRKHNISGFLTPDIDDMRKLYDIETGEFFDLELPAFTPEEVIAVGKFNFSKKTFAKAIAILDNASAKWLIVDEAGKLEIEQHIGLEPALSVIINKYKADRTNKKLILVIRDTLLEKAIIKYELAGAKIIHSLTTL